MLFEDYSLVLLIGHAVAALGCVALTTHLSFWLAYRSRGTRSHRSTRRFGIWAAAAYATTMLLGLALYPTYKVRVRSEYLDNPGALSRATEERARAARLAEARDRESKRFRSGDVGHSEPLAEPDAEDRALVLAKAEASIARGAKLARWFDVKEHWSALGLMLACALALLLWVEPSEESQRTVSRMTWGLAVVSAALAWFAAVVGVIVAAARSVAGI